MKSDNRQSVLFLCTGNYYRSRFAELYFNHRAAERELDWSADSRGLATELGIYNVGPISRHTLEAIDRHRISATTPHRMPVQVSEADLSAASLIVALKEDEHRKMVAAKHPAWGDRVVYWHVHDLDLSGPDEAIAQIARLVDGLIDTLCAKPRATR